MSCKARRTSGPADSASSAMSSSDRWSDSPVSGETQSGVIPSCSSIAPRISCTRSQLSGIPDSLLDARADVEGALAGDQRSGEGRVFWRRSRAQRLWSLWAGIAQGSIVVQCLRRSQGEWRARKPMSRRRIATPARISGPCTAREGQARRLRRSGSMEPRHDMRLDYARFDALTLLPCATAMKMHEAAQPRPRRERPLRARRSTIARGRAAGSSIRRGSGPTAPGR